MTIQQAQEIAVAALADNLVKSTLVGPVFIKAMKTNSFSGRKSYIRFDYYRNKREYYDQHTKITKQQAADLLATYQGEM